MNDWASRLLSGAGLLETTKKADLDQFIQEVSNDQVERMYIQKKIDVALETRPTFEQVSLDRIYDEMSKNLTALKSLENIIHERMTGYNAFFASISRTRPFFEGFDNHEGTLRLAFDSFSVLIEQEILQSKQQVFLGDLKKSLSSMRADSQKRIVDYQREIANAEKDVENAEAKLRRSKDRHEKAMDHRNRMEYFDTETSRLPGRGALKEDRLREAEENIARGGKEIQDDVRLLLRTIGNRDQVLTASRKAFQKLDGECKAAVHSTLRKIVEKERENADIHKEIVEKLDSSVSNVNLAMDTTDFIDGYGRTEGALLLCSQALSLLGDLTPTGVHHQGQGHGSGRTSGDASPAANRSRSVSFGSNKDAPTGLGAANAGGGAILPGSRQNSRSSIASNGSGGSISSPPTGGSSSSGAAGNGSLPATLLVGLSKSEVDAALSSPSGKVAASTPVQALAQAAVAETAAAASAKLSLTRAFTTHLCRLFYHNSKVPDDLASYRTCTTDNLVLEDLEAEMTGKDFSDDEDDEITEAVHRKRRSTGTDLETAAARAHSGEELERKSAARQLREKIPNWMIHPTGGRVSGTIKRASKHIRTVVRDKAAANNFGDKQSSRVHPSDVKDEDGVDPEIVATKSAYRKNKVNHDVSYRDLNSPPSVGWLTGPDGSKRDSALVESVDWMCKAVRSQTARDVFTAELNQFRSRKVDIGEGFDALGAVLWTALSNCQRDNDVHNAKVIMMLSQTFFRQIKPASCRSDAERARSSEDATTKDEGGSSPDDADNEHGSDNDDDDDDGEGEAARGVEFREFIKELLIEHPLWKDGQYWEQALWQCAMEQLHTIPYDMYWHDMTTEDRTRAVRRVHDVIFSQVMAITHSMMELGCSPTLSREFLYRMCVIHQLGEAQRQQLLAHVLEAGAAADRSEQQKRERERQQQQELQVQGPPPHVADEVVRQQAAAVVGVDERHVEVVSV